MEKIFNKKAVDGILLLMGYKNNEDFFDVSAEKFYDDQQKFIDYLNDSFGINMHYFR